MTNSPRSPSFLSSEKRQLLALLLQERGVKRVPQDAVRPRSRSATLPLSSEQQRLWFLDQLEPGSSFYNLPTALRLTGPLDVGALERSLGQIVRRHESLRTSFQMRSGQLVQMIAPTLEPPLLRTDLSALANGERETELGRRVTEEAQKPFDLAQGPLIRTTLLRLQRDEHALLVTVHHIVFDDWSRDVFFGELSALYEAAVLGRASPLPELSVHYADYALWQRDRLQEEESVRQVAYWKEKLGGNLPVLELPTDRPRPANQTFRGAYESIYLPKKLTRDLKALARKEGVTLFMVLLAAYQTLLSRYSAQDDILVGSPIANRQRIETEGLIGFFLNTLVLRTDLSGDPSFRELLGRVRETTLGAYEHQDVPFEKLVEELEPERSLSRNPLFQVAFVLRNAPRRPHKLYGLDTRPLASDIGASKFDLNLLMAEEPDGLQGSLEYSTDLFDASTARRMLSHLQTLLEGIVVHPDRPIGELPLLGEEERHQVIVEWNQTARDYPPTKILHALFEEQVDKDPDATAVLSGLERLTYGELNERANRLAGYLMKRGVGPDVRVGLCVERSPAMVVGLLGILKAGGAYLPLDPSYPPQRLAFLREDAGAPVVLTQAGLAGLLPEAGFEKVLIDSEWADIARESPTNPPRRSTSENLAYVIYTSGSTGVPKGVMTSHAGICNRLIWMQEAYGLTPADRVLQKTPFSFDVSVWEFFWTLLNGARLVLAAPGEHRDSARIAQLIEEEKVTIAHFVPSMLRVFLQEARPEQCASLRQVFCSGEALPAKVQQLFFERLDAKLDNLYGPTEASVDVTFWSCARGDTAATVPIGRPIANTQIYVLDRKMEPLPIGVPGELWIGGAGLARGYLNRPDLTAERFRANPFLDSPARIYRSGDLARFRADGNLEFLGREDDQVKIRGFRIELGEIASVIAEHPAVSQSVVIAREDASGEKRLVAYVVLRERELALNTELRTFVAEKLPEHMLPSSFVALEALPVTSSGKIDRRALPAPDQSRPDLADAYVAPNTAVEEVVAGIWSDVLGLERVGLKDNFFALGGHSLLAMQVVTRVREAFHLDLPLRVLFESPNVSAIAERIETARRKPEDLRCPPIRPARRDRPLPLSFAQEPLWFVDQLRPGNASYNVPYAVRMRGVLNRPALRWALDSIVERHESLRTTFGAVDGSPVQLVASPAGVALPLIDLCDWPQVEAEREVRRVVDNEVQRPFDLARGPLFRGSLLRLADDDYVLLINMHHIIADGWSIGVLFQELSVLYESFASGKASPLTELPVQYADYAVWQREWLRGKVLETQLGYWTGRLAGAPPLLNLPTDRPRSTEQSFRGARQLVNLSKDLTDELKAVARREGVTLFMLLLALFQLLLSRYSGETDIVVGTDVANRNHLEIEGLIGFFINNVVMRTDLSGDPTLRELLARVREVALGAYANQDLPFTKLVEVVNPERRAGYTPVFQTLFVLQNTPSSEPNLPGLSLTPIEIDSHTSKFELAVFIKDTHSGLGATWSYKTDLFDESTISRMVTHFEILLRSCSGNPDAALSSFEILTERERKEKSMAAKERQEARVQTFRSVKRKALDLSQVSVVRESLGRAEATMPLVLEPNLTNVNLAEWASNNLEFISSKLRVHGAILFRGFGVASPAEFERVAAAICPELFGEYGDLPRESVSGNVYRSTPYPPDQAILFHNESSHMHRWPMKIFFYCVQAAREGGETPIVDIRRVYQRLAPALRDRFREKKLMYVRNYIGGLDVSWQSFFQTTDKEVVESYCRKVGLNFEWKRGDVLNTSQISPAVARHPSTGEMVFFNQIQLHHVSCLERAVRESLLSTFPEKDLPRNVYYGDGSRLEESVVADIVGIYRELEVKEPWHEGDIVMLDNMLAAHARDPYVGPRKIVVSMGEIVTQQQVEW